MPMTPEQIAGNLIGELNSIRDHYEIDDYIRCQTNEEYFLMIDAAEIAIREAVARERERCAILIEWFTTYKNATEPTNWGKIVAAAIREGVPK